MKHVPSPTTASTIVTAQPRNKCSTVIDRERAIAHAKRYPFALPNSSYLLVNGYTWPLHSGDKISAGLLVSYRTDRTCKVGISDVTGFSGALEDSLGEDRTPVVAWGSNGSAEQLTRKFQVEGNPIVIPVIQGELKDFTVVYSAHFAQYGSIAATPQYTLGTSSVVFVTFLSSAQLEQMHSTEKNYTFRKFDDISLHLDNGMVLDTAYAYVSRHGCLYFNGGNIALSKIPCSKMLFPHMEEEAVLTLARDLVAPDKELDEFIYENIIYEEIRNLRTEKLHEFSSPFEYDDTTIIW